MSNVHLTDCDREPVHIPGAIQPHGVLVALSEPSLRITHVSSNVTELFGVEPRALLGLPLAEALGEGTACNVLTALNRERIDVSNPLAIAKDGLSFDGLLHRHRGATILELETRAPSAVEPFSAGAHLHIALGRLKQVQSVDELGALAVQQVRELTGFDRVMLYHFAPDDHGEVLYEAKTPELEPFRGLHYPASDIPAQARALYVLNGTRAIPDLLYRPVPIVPPCGPGADAPLDLSLSTLRGVSPVHVEYLSNMGVRASMSIALTRGQRLWGLIACHHREPRVLPYVVRNACELFGRFLALQMEDLERGTAQTRQKTLRQTVDAIAGAISSVPAERSSFMGHGAPLVQLMGANGAAVVRESGIETIGVTPSHEQLAALATWLHTQGGVASTNALSRVYPPGQAFAQNASGLLATSSPTQPPLSVMWFRPEVVQTVTWGGRESSPSDASGPLRPRRSFAAWKELVKGQSVPWSAEELDAAEALRRALIEADLTRQICRAERAVAARDDLVAIVSHDLRNPLNVIKVAAQLLARGANERTVERIQRAVTTMETLISDLLDLAKVEAGRFVVTPQSVGSTELVEDALALVATIAEQKSVRLETRLATVSVRADRDRMLQVFSNLLGNAVKFTPCGGVIVVSSARVGDSVRFSVTDSGIGIPRDQLAHVFDRYWQSSTIGKKGAGLGLFIAKGIIEAHGARLEAESEVGKGTSFSFALPVASREEGYPR